MPTQPSAEGVNPQGVRPAIEINIRGVHVRIERLHRPSRWLMSMFAALIGALLTGWHLIVR
jgi:hypothetical protein